MSLTISKAQNKLLRQERKKNINQKLSKAEVKLLKQERAEVEHIFQIFFDTKKELHYDKHTGNWEWSDKEDDHHYGTHTTAISAMIEAVEPYLEEDDS